MPIPTNGFQLNDAVSIAFTENSIEFQCKYARAVRATSTLAVPTQPSKIIGNGDLTYGMEITVGALGGDTDVTISPNHNISGISPR